MNNDLISRQAAINGFYEMASNIDYLCTVSDYVHFLECLPSVEHERREVTPHRNYQYLSDYWCECGNHLGKKHEVTYCSNCGRKVNWDE